MTQPVNIRILRSNMTEVSVGPFTLLFSYETCIAALNPIHPWALTHIIVDATEYSKTTTSHLNLWLHMYDQEKPLVETMSRGEFNDKLRELLSL